MKGLIKFIFITNIISLFEANPIKEHFNRNKATIELFLSRFQFQTVLINVFNHSFFNVKIDNVHFFQPILSSAIYDDVEVVSNHIKAHNFILPFLCNITLKIKDTVKEIHEYDFIFEINITNAAFKVGKSLSKFMALDMIPGIIMNYSKKRNFLVSKRFSEFLTEESKLISMIRTTLLMESYNIFRYYNYYQYDFAKINILIKNTPIFKLEHKVNDTTTLISYYYSNYGISSSVIFNQELEVNNYQIMITYKLKRDNQKEIEDLLQITCKTVLFSYDNNIIFISRSYHPLNIDQALGDFLFDKMKEVFEDKKKAYYDLFQ